MSSTTMSKEMVQSYRAAPIGCETVCAHCSQCAPLMWAIEKWMAGWSVPKMRESLAERSFAQVADQYTGIAVLNSERFQAHLIARRLRRHWNVNVVENKEDDYSMIVTNKSGGPRKEFKLRISSESRFAARYLLHAVLFTPSDVFEVVANAFGSLCTESKQTNAGGR